MFKYLSHKTALGNARRALSAAQFFKKQFGHIYDVDEVCFETIGFVDALCITTNIPTILECYSESNLREPGYSNEHLSRLAHETAKQYCWMQKDNKDYFVYAIATAYLSMLSTPIGLGGRQELWIKIIDMLNVGVLYDAFTQEH